MKLISHFKKCTYVLISKNFHTVHLVKCTWVWLDCKVSLASLTIFLQIVHTSSSSPWYFWGFESQYFRMQCFVAEHSADSFKPWHQYEGPQVHFSAPKSRWLPAKADDVRKAKKNPMFRSNISLFFRRTNGRTTSTFCSSTTMSSCLLWRE